MSSTRDGAALYNKRHGRQTTTEPAKPSGTLDAGAQLYNARRKGVQILPGEDTGTDVTPGTVPDAA